MAGSVSPIIECRGLSKIYQRRKRTGTPLNPFNWFNFEKEEILGIDDIDITIHPGEKIGIVGMNGAGKSTLVKLITGIIRPTTGSISLFDLDPFENRKLVSNNYGVIFGNRRMLWQHVPVMESLKLAADIYQLDATTFQKHLDLFDSVLGIQDLLHVPPRKLSFGQRMTCQIVYSLIHLPQVIILDEATIGLDVVVRQRVINLLNQLVEIEGIT